MSLSTNTGQISLFVRIIFKRDCLLRSVFGFHRTMSWSIITSDEQKKMEVGTSLPMTDQRSSQKLTPPADNQWSHMKMSSVSLTGIVCELGPSSRDPSTLLNMLQNGMTVAKINCSKASYEYNAKIINNLQAAIMKHREVSDICLPCAVGLETCGPEIRTGPLRRDISERVELKKGDLVNVVFTESFEDKFSSRHTIFVNRPKLSIKLQEQSSIFIGDERVVLSVKKHDSDVVACCVVKEGIFGSGMAVHIPGTTTDLSKKVKEDIEWGLRHGMDIVFVPLTESPQHIRKIKTLLGDHSNNVKVFAKIEHFEAYMNIEDIFNVADGLFIARDALSTSILPQHMFPFQKALIFGCHKLGKPAIVGGQVLESMMNTNQASRCEITDIFTSVLDGADCIELSAETAFGQYPKETVATLSSIFREAESAIQHNQVSLDLMSKMLGPLEGDHAAAIAAVKAAIVNKAKSIICITSTGRTAILLSNYSPPCPLVAVTSDLQVAKELLLHQAVLPIVYEEISEKDWMIYFDNYLRHGVKYGVRSNFLKKGDSIIVISRWKKSPGFTDSVRIVVEYVDRYIDN